MLVHLDLAAVIQLFCLVQGLTTAVYLLVARPRQPDHRWLGLLLLSLTLQVADYFLSRSGIYIAYELLNRPAPTYRPPKAYSPWLRNIFRNRRWCLPAGATSTPAATIPTKQLPPTKPPCASTPTIKSCGKSYCRS